MKNIFFTFVLLFSFSVQAHTDKSCKMQNIICIIDVESEGNCIYYKLETSEELINKIRANCNGNYNEEVSLNALKKLTAQGTQLVNAGVCKVLINNIE